MSANDQMEGENIELLSAVEDKHGGVVVDVEDPMDSLLFTSKLEASMSNWRQQVRYLARFSMQGYLFLHSLITNYLSDYYYYY